MWCGMWRDTCLEMCVAGRNGGVVCCDGCMVLSVGKWVYDDAYGRVVVSCCVWQDGWAVLCAVRRLYSVVYGRMVVWCRMLQSGVVLCATGRSCSVVCDRTVV